jgi:protein-S-isoprenylcysteine O-methyltransferase Ste14
VTFPLIKAIVILPGTALVYVPALIIWLTRNTSQAANFPPASAITWLAGVAFAVAGLWLMIWTIRLFVSKGGGGTPAPWRPIRNLIVVGPYRYVRNPMIVGVNLFMIAEAVLLHSFPILVWMIVFVAVNTIYFALSEEPQLQKRFDQSYTDYKRQVPRWIPRLTPYRGGDERQGLNS